MRRYITVLSVLENIRDFFKLLWGVVVALKKLKHHQIQKVFCKGGYVSLPVCLAARVWGIPIFVHESDMHAGLTNRLVAKVAKTVFTGFPDVI